MTGWERVEFTEVVGSFMKKTASRTTFYTYAVDAYNDQAIDESVTYRGEHTEIPTVGIMESRSQFTGIKGYELVDYTQSFRPDAQATA